MVTGRDALEDKLEGLERGVDDYLTKPFATQELEARLTAVIRRNPKVTAINSAIEVDLTGQVCADSIGPRMYSGVGGQMDFMRGAALSPGANRSSRSPR